MPFNAGMSLAIIGALLDSRFISQHFEDQKRELCIFLSLNFPSYAQKVLELTPISVVWHWDWLFS